MSTLIAGVFNGLLYSSLILLFVCILLMFVRWVLIKNNYSRSVVLKLWMGIPVGLLAGFMVMNLTSQEVYLMPTVITIPIEIDMPTEFSWHIAWSQWLVLLWFLVASVKVFALIRQYISTKNTLFTNCQQLNDKLYQCDMDITPMAFGWVKPVIILPHSLKQELTAEEMRLVELHESIHCQRHDPCWRLSFELLCCLYWFLPLKRITQNALIDDQEMSCDERVINQSKDITRYARLLLQLNTRKRSFNDSTMLCSSSFNLKERIMKLNQNKNKAHQGLIIGLFFMAMLVVSSVSALAKVESVAKSSIELKRVHTMAPQYPLSAYQQKIIGEVKLNFLVTTEGHVEAIKVIDSSPAGVFDKAAIRAIKQWTFEPIDQATETEQVLEFRLD